MTIDRIDNDEDRDDEIVVLWFEVEWNRIVREHKLIYSKAEKGRMAN